MERLNLGCGKNIRKGYLNVDKIDMEGVDVVCDLERSPYPFKDDRFDYIYCDNVLEHLEDLIPVMEELCRISKNGAEIEVLVPYFANFNAFKDPTHKSFFTLDTFNYFTEDSPWNFYTKARFRIKSRELIFPKHLGMLSRIFNRFWKAYQRNLSYIFPATAIRFRLEVTK